MLLNSTWFANVVIKISSRNRKVIQLTIDSLSAAAWQKKLSGRLFIFGSTLWRLCCSCWSGAMGFSLFRSLIWREVLGHKNGRYDLKKLSRIIPKYIEEDHLYFALEFQENLCNCCDYRSKSEKWLRPELEEEQQSQGRKSINVSSTRITQPCQNTLLSAKQIWQLDLLSLLWWLTQSRLDKVDSQVFSSSSTLYKTHILLNQIRSLLPNFVQTFPKENESLRCEYKFSYYGSYYRIFDKFLFISYFIFTFKKYISIAKYFWNPRNRNRSFSPALLLSQQPTTSSSDTTWMTTNTPRREKLVPLSLDLTR